MEIIQEMITYFIEIILNHYIHKHLIEAHLIMVWHLLIYLLFMGCVDLMLKVYLTRMCSRVYWIIHL